MKLSQALFFLSVFLFSVAAFSADEKPQDLSFKLDCKNGDKHFIIDFNSPSKDWTEDDMKVTFGAPDKSLELKLPVQTYYYTPHIAKTQNSICKTESQQNAFTAYALNKNQIILFVKSSGRPGLDFVQAAVIDTNTGTLLDTKRLGTTRNSFVAVLKTLHGFKLRIVNDKLSLHKEVACDCDASFVDAWMEVGFNKNKISTKWL